VASRTLEETGCPYCSNKKVLKGFNDLKTLYPEIATEAYGWDPQTVTPGSGQKRRWMCKEGHIWDARIGHRVPPTNSGCPTCAEYGFSPEKQAWFYLMSRPGEQQFGITNDLPTRIKHHERNGWILLETKGPWCGKLVFDTEKKLKRWLANEIGVIDGTTENWRTTDMEILSLAELRKRSEIVTDLF